MDLLQIWLISLLGFLALWPISLWIRDSSIVDFWWGPGVGAMALAAWFGRDMPFGSVAGLLTVLTVLWSARLGIQLGLRRLREGEEDGRYRELRAAWDPGWWWKSLGIVFGLQSVLQGLMAAPVLAAIVLAPPASVSAASLFFAALALAGIALQTRADLELDRHKMKHGHGSLLTSGLRAYMRHPSYLGEILVWGGLSALAFEAGILWAPVSVGLVTVLLCYVSGVTVIDGRMMRTRPDTYPDYRARVPAILPRRRDIAPMIKETMRADFQA